MAAEQGPPDKFSRKGTPADVARVLGNVGAPAVRQWVRNGHIPEEHPDYGRLWYRQLGSVNARGHPLGHIVMYVDRVVTFIESGAASRPPPRRGARPAEKTRCDGT